MVSLGHARVSKSKKMGQDTRQRCMILIGIEVINDRKLNEIYAGTNNASAELRQQLLSVFIE